MTMHPYARHAYAEGLAHIGEALPVPEWGCSVLVRDIDGEVRDAIGCYPLTLLREDADVGGGLARLRGEGLVSFTMVLDDFHRPPVDRVQPHFDFVRPYKPHYLHMPNRAGASVSADHRYKARRAARHVRTGIFDLKDHLADWQGLYATLSSRHALPGTHRFPDDHIARLAQLKGVTAIGAWIDDRLVSAHIWARYGDQVHSHLGASSTEGYAVRAAYAVYVASFAHFADARTINLGGVADGGLASGLAQFKSGFSNATAPSYLCGAILDKVAYAGLAARRGARPDYFPAYRAPPIPETARMSG